MKTALDFVKMPESFAKKLLGKIGSELHRELSGISVYPVTTEEKTSYVTISKTKTFTPASKEEDFVYGQALRNLESACMKARRYSLRAKKLALFLRQQNFQDAGIEIKLPRPTNTTLDLIAPLSRLFNRLYQPGVPYRQTGVVLGELEVIMETQLNFFEDPSHLIKTEHLYEAVDELNAKYGKHKVHLANSLAAQKRHEGVRGELPERKKDLLKGENFRQRLGIPLLKHLH